LNQSDFFILRYTSLFYCYFDLFPSHCVSFFAMNSLNPISVLTSLHRLFYLFLYQVKAMCAKNKERLLTSS
jgi:hypothetical protein